MKFSQITLWCVLVLTTSAIAQNVPDRPITAPAVLDRLLSAKLDANVRDNVKSALDAAREGFVMAAQAKALRPRVQLAIQRAHEAADKAEHNLWGYGVWNIRGPDGTNRNAGEMNPAGGRVGAGVEVLTSPTRSQTRETDGLFEQVASSDHGRLSGAILSSPRPYGEYFAPDGGYYAGQYSRGLTNVANGMGVSFPAVSAAQTQIAGQFAQDLLNGAGVVFLKDGSILAGKWVRGKMIEYGAKYDARGRLLLQGPFVDTGISVFYDHPIAGLTLPALISSRDCNEEFYPPLSVRMREEEDVEVVALVGADGQPNASIWQSGGKARLDDAAMKCVASWRYAPAKLAGTAVNYILRVKLQMRVLHPIPPPLPVQ